MNPVSNTRATGENGGVRYDGPNHWAPMTWLRCIEEGCTVRVDPWLHKTRCPPHQAAHDDRAERARAIVKAAADAERRHRLSA